MTTPVQQPPADFPDLKHPNVERMEDRWKRCRDLFDGTDAIHAGGERYLRKFEKENPKDYERRSTQTEVYNGFARTIRAMVGLVFQRDPVLGADNPAPITEHWENIDGKGTHGAVFVRDLFQDGLIVGHGGILVDYPAVADPETVTLAIERELGLRPYWVHIRAEDIISWRFVQSGGFQVLTQLVLRETTEEPFGAFGVQCVERYRVFRLDIATGAVTWELWEPTVAADGKSTTLQKRSDGGVRNQRRIPFAGFIAGTLIAPLTTRPPLLDLADVNLAHYRVSADRRNVISLACAPTVVRVGVPDDAPPVVLGPSCSIDVPVNGDAKWLEVTGTAFGPTKDELEALEQRMGSLGFAFLFGDTRQAETAEAKRIDAGAQNATLASSVRGLKDCVESALGFHAAYLSAAGGTIDLNTDFEQTVLAPDMITALSTLEANGQLDLETFLDLLKRGRVLPDGTAPKDIQARLVASGQRSMVGPGGTDPAPELMPPAGGGA